MTGSKKRRFINNISKISSCKTRRTSGYHFQVNVRIHRFTLDMNFQYLFSPNHIWDINGNLTVKTSRS